MRFELKFACGQDSIMVPYYVPWYVLKNLNYKSIVVIVVVMFHIIGHARLAHLLKKQIKEAKAMGIMPKLFPSLPFLWKWCIFKLKIYFPRKHLLTHRMACLGLCLWPFTMLFLPNNGPRGTCSFGHFIHVESWVG